MKSDYFVNVICDACYDEVANIRLTDIPNGTEDGLQLQLAKLGWKNIEGDDLCPECVGVTTYVQEDYEEI
jgi:hypothetical protein